MDAPRDRGRGLAVPAAAGVSASTRPFLAINPRSGSGEPTAGELAAAAREAGIDVRLVGDGEDAGSLARAAAERGATALGVAGGDGSLGRVAAAALERDLPFVPVPFGTRNHFARDVGLDVGDPIGALAAFSGEERRVDVGTVARIVFLNNVSLGLYASFVHDPRRRTKNRLVAFARMFKAAAAPTRRPLDLRFDVEGRTEHHRALVCLVASNDYDVRSISDLRAREHLDEGRLHAYVIEATSTARLVGVLARAAVGRVSDTDNWAEYTAPSFRIESRRRSVHAAVDGEPVMLPPRLDFEIRPRALRVLLPGPRDGAEDDARRH